jgi:acyl carrier protein
MSVEQKVIEVVSQVTGVDPRQLTVATRLMDDLGADELDVIEAVLELEDEFDISIPDDAVERVRTIGDLVWCVEARLGMPSTMPAPPPVPPAPPPRDDFPAAVKVLRLVSRCVAALRAFHAFYALVGAVGLVLLSQAGDDREVAYLWVFLGVPAQVGYFVASAALVVLRRQMVSADAPAALLDADWGRVALSVRRWLGWMTLGSLWWILARDGRAPWILTPRVPVPAAGLLALFVCATYAFGYRSLRLCRVVGALCKSQAVTDKVESAARNWWILLIATPILVVLIVGMWVQSPGNPWIPLLVTMHLAFVAYCFACLLPVLGKAALALAKEGEARAAAGEADPQADDEAGEG